jgi:hypothetical protein
MLKMAGRDVHEITLELDAAKAALLRAVTLIEAVNSTSQ